MVFPAAYEKDVINKAVAQATSPSDSDFVQNEINAPEEIKKAKIYLPEDEELRKNILDAREDLKNLRDYSIKNNFNEFQTKQLVQELLNDYGLTKEQVAGVYESNGENIYKSFTNRINTNLQELFKVGADYLPYFNFSASDIDEYLSQEKEYRDDLKNTIEEAFKKAKFVDPNFTPNGLAERVADKTASGVFLGLSFAGGGAALTAPKVAGQIPAGANILKQMGPDKFKNNVYDTAKKVIDEIVTLYKRSPATAALTDVLATTGWELGELPADLSEKKIEELSTTEAVWRGVLPFASSLALPGVLYGFPKATLDVITNIADEGLSKALFGKFKQIFDKKSDAKAYEDAKSEIQQSVENDFAKANLKQSQDIEDLVEPVIASENAKKATRGEAEDMAFNMTLAERTQDPQLIKTQSMMEGDLPVRTEILTNRQERALKNKAVLDATVAAEFPDAIPVTRKFNDGTVEQVLEPVKKFNTYVDPQKNLNAAIIDDVPGKIAAAEEKLLKTFPRVPDEVLKDAGIYLRGELGTRAKNKQDELYGELEQLVNQLNPNIVVNNFVDDVVSSLALKPFQTTADLPFEYTALKDLTKPMDQLLARIGPALENGQITIQEFDEFIFALNQQLKRAAQKGDAPFGLAPQYDPESRKFTLTAAEVVGLKKSIQASLNKALRNPSSNSEKIRRLSLLQEKTNNLLKERPEGLGPEVTVEGRIPFGGEGREITFPYSDAIENWLKKYNAEYLDQFEKGVILKLRTETGEGNYKLPAERVGAAFLESADNVEQFGKFFADNPLAIEGIENAFYDTMIKNVFKPSGVIDNVKLDKFKADNIEIINKLDEIIPNFKADLESKTDVGINLANKINEQNARLNVAGRIELENLAKDKALFRGITYKDADDMVKKALADPDDMEKIVTAIAQNDPDGIMLQAFKREIFKDWSAGIMVDIRKGKYPKYEKMNEYLDKHKDSFDTFFGLMNDPQGFDRLKLITDAYERLGAIPFPIGRTDPAELRDIVKSVFGTGAPQILSRLFAVASGRTGIKFVAGEILARMFRQLSIRKRNDLIAKSLYDRDFSESLVNMIVGQDIKSRDIENMIGYLGQIGGMMTDGISYDINKEEADSFEKRREEEMARTIGDQSQAVIPPQPVLNSPTISPASSLNQVSMAFLPPVGGNRGQLASRGQQVFGATDTVFG